MEIKVLTSPSCHVCKSLKLYLESKNIPFKTIDVTKDTAERDTMEVMTLPQIKVDGRETIISFNKAKVDELIKDYEDLNKGSN